MEPFDSNLSQAEYCKLMVYNAYIKQKQLSKVRTVDAICNGLSANLGEKAAQGLLKIIAERRRKSLGI